MTRYRITPKEWTTREAEKVFEALFAHFGSREFTPAEALEYLSHAGFSFTPEKWGMIVAALKTNRRIEEIDLAQ